MQAVWFDPKRITVLYKRIEVFARTKSQTSVEFSKYDQANPGNHELKFQFYHI